MKTRHITVGCLSTTVVCSWTRTISSWELVTNPDGMIDCTCCGTGVLEVKRAPAKGLQVIFKPDYIELTIHKPWS